MKKRRLLSIVLSLCMVLALMPQMVFAGEGTSSGVYIFFDPSKFSDWKAPFYAYIYDEDTDSDNIMTEHNGCVSEFIVNVGSLNKYAKRDGNISSCTDDWNSPVVEIRVYQENVLGK